MAVLPRTRAHGDAAAINDYLGASVKVEQAFVAFASAYADQNERDHAPVITGWHGRVAAQSALWSSARNFLMCTRPF
jgi:hypothetical protein